MDTAKPDSFFCSAALWHDGHSGAGEDARTSVSNSVPQSRQAYSNIGMICKPPDRHHEWPKL